MTIATNTFTASARHQMLNTFAGVAHQFEQAKHHTAVQEQRFNARLIRLGQELEQLQTPPAQLSFDRQHPLAQQFGAVNKGIQHNTQQWLYDIAGQEKGTDFRQKLGDSLLVFVYGKVKAGKSSLSNFMACGQSQPSQAHLMQAKQQGLQMKREVESGAATEQSTLENGFGVARQECTNAIQYFTLPGLTWIDSPGLHSENENNGELSREYAASADLIIYVMNAANPGRESDIHELNQLVKINKPVLVLITSCDREVLDEDEQGNVFSTTVMFTEQERQNQVAYVQQRLKDLCINNAKVAHLVSSRILPISVHMAEQASTADEFANSGMQDLLAHLAHIANHDSVQLKQQAPLNNLRTFIDKTMGSLNTIDDQLQQMAQALQASRLEVEQEAPRLVNRIQYGVHGRLRAEMSRYQGDNNTLLNGLQQELEQQLIAQIESSLGGTLRNVSQSLQQAIKQHQSAELPDFGKLFNDFEVNERHTGYKNLGRLAAGLVGGALGLAFAGPIGAAAGATAASTLGGSLINKERTRILSLPVGDNRDDIADSARQQFDKLAEQAVERAYTKPMLQALQGLSNSTQQSRTALQQFRNTTIAGME